MMKHQLTRRGVMAGVAAVSCMPTTVFGSDVIELEWNDLLPEGTSEIPNSLLGIVEHDESSLASQQPLSSGIRSEWNGKTVRLPGFVVPVDYDGTGVTAFILVPYVGACVHVPPPPANQLVLVSTKKPFALDGLFDAVSVTGKIGTASIATELADVGYTMEATKITPYS